MEETGILENPALLSLVLPDFEPGPKVGLVQIRCFSGNSTDDERALTVQGSQRGAPKTFSGAAEAGVAEHFQPMWVRLPGQ
jgi:hypothetical protein